MKPANEGDIGPASQPGQGAVVPGDHSVRFFDEQFQRQIRAHEFALNPFEQTALPYLRGRVLDFGCGMGNLACAAAQRGCSVLALDASAAAIAHLTERATAEVLAVEARQADLRDYELAGIGEPFDTVVSIGLLMFFDCAGARRTLSRLQEAVRAGGIAIINVLVEGTTYLDMFDAHSHCLFPRDEMERSFAGWRILHSEYRDFPAPGERIKSFVTLVAQKP